MKNDADPFNSARAFRGGLELQVPLVTGGTIHDIDNNRIDNAHLSAKGMGASR
jgi:hypothetical protein